MNKGDKDYAFAVMADLLLTASTCRPVAMIPANGLTNLLLELGVMLCLDNVTAEQIREHRLIGVEVGSHVHIPALYFRKIIGEAVALAEGEQEPDVPVHHSLEDLVKALKS